MHWDTMKNITSLNDMSCHQRMYCEGITITIDRCGLETPSVCYKNEQVKLKVYAPPPDWLRALVEDRQFLDKIRSYNVVFSFIYVSVHLRQRFKAKKKPIASRAGQQCGNGMMNVEEGPMNNCPTMPTPV